MSIKERVGDEFFTHCPRKHKLPNRVKNKGRCTPDECCIAVDGAHSAVKQAHALKGAAKAEVSAYAEETERMLDARGRMTAWDEVHPLPKVATAPEFKPGTSVFQYLRERTAQAAPLALERIIRKALLVPGPAGDAAADNLLDRMGFSRRGDAPIEFNGPVSIINLDPARVPLLAQKPQVIQGEVLTRSSQGEVNGESISGEAEGRGRLVGGEGADGAGARVPVREVREETPSRSARPEDGDSEG